MPPAEFVKIAIDLILVVVLVHEVRHVTERLQFASRVIQACNHKALKNLVIGSPNRTEANLIEKAAVNEVRAYQAKLVLAYTGKTASYAAASSWMNNSSPNSCSSAHWRALRSREIKVASSRLLPKDFCTRYLPLTLATTWMEMVPLLFCFRRTNILRR